MAETTNKFGVVGVPKSSLPSEYVPAPGSKFVGAIEKFALTFDGYSHCADRCGDIANKALHHYGKTGKLPIRRSAVCTERASLDQAGCVHFCTLFARTSPIPNYA